MAIDYPRWVDERLSAEIPVLRARGEGQDLEYMQSFPQQARELGKEIAAFATSNSGLILLGVDNNGDLMGLKDVGTVEERDRLIRRVEGVCRGTVKPAITPSLAFALDSKRVLLAIRVPKGSQAVYYCKNIPYVRHVTEARPAEPHEVVDLISRSAGLEGRRDTEDEQATEWYSALALLVTRVLVYADELEGRQLNPWLDGLMAIFGDVAANSRELAASGAFASTEIEQLLEELADVTDKVGDYQHVMGPESWARFSEYVENAERLANQLKVKCIDTKPLGESSVRGALEQLEKTVRIASSLMRRAEEMLDEGRFDEFQGEASQLGERILSMAYVEFDRLDRSIVERLRAVGHKLHLLEAEQPYLGVGFTENLLATANEGVRELETVVAEIHQWVNDNGLPTEPVRNV